MLFMKKVKKKKDLEKFREMLIRKIIFILKNLIKVKNDQLVKAKKVKNLYLEVILMLHMIENLVVEKMKVFLKKELKVKKVLRNILNMSKKLLKKMDVKNLKKKEKNIQKKLVVKNIHIKRKKLQKEKFLQKMKNIHTQMKKVLKNVKEDQDKKKVILRIIQVLDIENQKR